MKIHTDISQGSPQWLQLRAGVVTASQMAPLVVTDKRKTSTSRWRPGSGAGVQTLCAKLVAELIHGGPISDDDGFVATDRGLAMEAEARDYYERATGLQTQIVGFVSSDDGREGCSPDALADPDGGVEIKCPLIHTHIGYLLDHEKMVKQYRHQVQGSLLVTGRAWWDLWSYCPSQPDLRIRVTPDEDYQAALRTALTALRRAVDEGVATVEGAWKDSLAKAAAELFR